ncbi:MAG: class I SAM-dependent methyltransferase [Desulfurococcales archaeon]|nr:class I SAM-dependent methyltransferase [Desulfurococcales archaeon]
MRARLMRRTRGDVAEVYDEIAEGYVHWRARAWPIVKLVRGRKISDLGSGPCTNGAEVVGRGSAEYAICLDISLRMLEMGLRKYGGKLLIDFIAGDIRFLPFRSKSLDSILLIAVLHHISPKDIGKVLGEVARVVHELGLILITTWSPWQARFLIHLIRNYLMKLVYPRIFPREVLVPWRKKGVTYFRTYYLYTLTELKNLVAKYVKPRVLLSSMYSRSRKAKSSQNNLIIAIK